LLPELATESSIVVHDISCHSVGLETPPTTGTKEADTIACLSSKNFPHTQPHRDTCRIYKILSEEYKLDDIARKRGHSRACTMLSSQAQSFLTRVCITPPRYHANTFLIKSCGHKGTTALQNKITLQKFRTLRDFS